MSYNVNIYSRADIERIVDECLASRIDQIARKVDARIKKGAHIPYHNGIVADDAHPAEVFNLSVRAFNCLKAANVTTVAQLAAMTETDLLKYRYLGKVTLLEIKGHLLSAGRHLSSSTRTD